MTVNVSVRVPDGIVLGCDSLATSLLPVTAQVTIPPTPCSKCGAEVTPGVIQMPPFGVPGGSTPLASKLFYVANFGVTFFGSSAVNGRSLFNHVMVFRSQTYKNEMTLQEVAESLGTQLATAAGQDPAFKSLAPKTPICGFQICGYDVNDVDMGKVAKVDVLAGEAAAIVSIAPQGYGVAVSGDQRVIAKLFGEVPNLPIAKPDFRKMTLHDAIDYARFLIQTTAEYQRFAEMVPVVGGPVEIAVMTKWIGFRWIQRKRLLGEEATRLNVGKIAHEIGRIRAELPDIVHGASGGAVATRHADDPVG